MGPGVRARAPFSAWLGLGAPVEACFPTWKSSPLTMTRSPTVATPDWTACDTDRPRMATRLCAG